MSEKQRTVFIRRGSTVKGPIPRTHVTPLVKAGKLLPSDEVAEALTGPWALVGEFLRAADLAVIETITIDHSILQGTFSVSYTCPRCRESLASKEDEISQSDACPKCRQRYRLSPRAEEQLRQAKDRLEQARAAKHAKNEQAAADTIPIQIAGTTTSAWWLPAREWNATIRSSARAVIAIGCLIGVLSAAGYAWDWYRTNTPLATFERFARAKTDNLELTCPLLPIRNIRFDLRKTDSLTTPSTGTITYSTVHPLRQDAEGKEIVIEGDAECEIICGKQGQRWIFQSATIKSTNWRIREADDNNLAKTIVTSMNREGLPTEVIEDGWNGVKNRMCEFEKAGFSMERLASLSKNDAYRLGRSRVLCLTFDSLSNVEPDAMRELVESRKSFLQERKGQGENDWIWAPENGYGVLELDGLPAISDALAKEVAAFKGTVNLNTIESLSDTAAEHLATHRGPLYLRKLTKLSPHAETVLAQHTDDLGIGVTTLSDTSVDFLAIDNWPENRLNPEQPKHVTLSGLAEISEPATTAIINSPCRFTMPGLKTLTSARLAEKLVADADEEGVTGESLQLGELQSVSDEVAEVVVQFPGDVELYNLQTLTSESLARKIAKDSDGRSLRLPKLRDLSPTAARVLADFSGKLEISSDDIGLDALSPDVVAVLARHHGELDVSFRALMPDVAQALSAHEGKLDIHCREAVPSQVLDLLTAHKGEVFLECHEPVSIRYFGGNNTPLRKAD
jgi:ssDNA-binding Zn-finger/Zn-ribbon topoisomerase 1